MEHTPEVDLEKVVHRITYRPQGRLQNFRALKLSERSYVFNKLTPGMRQEILSKLSFDETVQLLDQLDLRRAHQILNRMQDSRRRQKIVMRLKNDLHSKIENFLQFHPQASTSLVHLNYVLLEGDKTVGETSEVIEDHVHNTGKIPAVLVNEAGTLAGEVSLGALVRASNKSRLGDHVVPIKTILYNASKSEVLSLLISEQHIRTALLDSDGSVLGIVYSDDVLDLLGESPASALYSFAGVEESERPFDSMWSKVRHRYQWLILNLFTSFFAATPHKSPTMNWGEHRCKNHR